MNSDFSRECQPVKRSITCKKLTLCFSNQCAASDALRKSYNPATFFNAEIGPGASQHNRRCLGSLRSKKKCQKMKLRALRKFVNKMINPKSKKSPDERIQRALLKIKKKFLKKKLSKKQTKRCIVKLCFIELSGYHVTFGLEQMKLLLGSKKLGDNRIGWMAVLVILGKDSGNERSIDEAIHTYLSNRSNEYGLGLVLSVLGGLADPSYAVKYAQMVADLAFSSVIADFTQKKALLCLARLVSSCKEMAGLEIVREKVGETLTAPSFGVRMCGASLIIAVLRTKAAKMDNVFGIVIKTLASILLRGETEGKDPPRSKDRDVPYPFLCMRLFRILSYKTKWDDGEVEEIEALITSTIDQCTSDFQSDKVFRSCMLVYEIANLTTVVPMQESVAERIVKYLLHAKTSSQSCLLSFALEKLALIVHAIPACAQYVTLSLPILFKIIRTRDEATDSRALQLLYVIANKNNGLQIVNELTDYIASSSLHIRESLCLKAAVLAMSYVPDELSCVKMLIQILNTGGDACSDKVWRSAAQMVIQNPPIQPEVTNLVFDYLTKIVRPHSNLVKLGAFLIGEYAKVAKLDGIQCCKYLISACSLSDPECRPMILSALMKLSVTIHSTRELAVEFFKSQAGSLNIEVAQRCREYLHLASTDIVSDALVMKMMMTSNHSRFMPVSEMFENAGSRRSSITVGAQNDKDPILQFIDCEQGEIYKDEWVIVRAAVVYDPPRLQLFINFENKYHDVLWMKDFEIESCEQLKFRVGSVPATLAPGERVSIQIEFVAMQVTDFIPSASISMNNQTIKFRLPVLMARWMETLPMDRQTFVTRWNSVTDDNLIKSLQLVIPDGNVMLVVADIVRRKLGLHPAMFEVPPNCLVFCGVFRCFGFNAGFLIRFTYIEADLDLTMTLHATDERGASVVAESIRRAFLS